MSWFFIALTALFLWSLVNLFDQYLVERYSKGEYGSGGLVLFSSLVGIIVAFTISLFKSGLLLIPLLDKILLIVTGGISILWIILYLYTLEKEDVSAVVPWFLTVPVFGYGLGYVLLGETLTNQQFIGSAITLSGVLIISVDFSGNNRKFKWRTSLIMLPACILIAICGVIFKYVTVGNDYWVSSFWEYIGLGFFGVLIYVFVPKFRNEFNFMNRTGGKKIFALNSISEILTIIGNLLTNYAILLAPVTLVYLVGSLQPAIVLIMTILATLYFPQIAKENLKLSVLIPKIIAIIIMIIGSIILFQ
jgi:drug/metabolite transporter (DMT)-like permease